MTYKCYECGHIFEDGEEKICREDYGETFRVCPSCGGTYGETVRCEICHGVHLEDELTSGICVECLQERATDYTTFLDFLKIEPYYPGCLTNLEEFWFTEVLDLSPWDMPKGSSTKMRRRIIAEIKREIAMEKATGGNGFKAHMRRYMETSPTALSDFAEFLADELRKGVNV